jgi:hypothetical protein
MIECFSKYLSVGVGPRAWGCELRSRERWAATTWAATRRGLRAMWGCRQCGGAVSEHVLSASLSTDHSPGPLPLCLTPPGDSSVQIPYLTSMAIHNIYDDTTSGVRRVCKEAG